jgi:hypothetical protein
VDLGVGDPGVVAGDGVRERGAHVRVVVPVAGLAGRGGAVPVALGAADEPPAAAVGDVAELVDVDVQQRRGPVVFVAADPVRRCAGRGARAG